MDCSWFQEGLVVIKPPPLSTRHILMLGLFLRLRSPFLMWVGSALGILWVFPSIAGHASSNFRLQSAMYTLIGSSVTSGQIHGGTLSGLLTMKSGTGLSGQVAK